MPNIYLKNVVKSKDKYNKTYKSKTKEKNKNKYKNY